MSLMVWVANFMTKSCARAGPGARCQAAGDATARAIDALRTRARRSNWKVMEFPPWCCPDAMLDRVLPSEFNRPDVVARDTSRSVRDDPRESRMTQAIDGEYDYIVVGAGSSGCLLANRLSADPDERACWCSRRAAATTGSGTTSRSAICSPSAIRAPTGCTARCPRRGSTAAASPYPRGKVIGGSSAINAMLYMRGQARDYDHWRQLGLTGWGWDDVLPFFKRHEDHCLGASAAHGDGGECRVERAARALGAARDVPPGGGGSRHPPIDDFNAGDNDGLGLYQVTQKRGRRWSAARGFLMPVLHRPNLRLELDCLVEAVEFDERRAVGVRWRQDGVVRRARCRGEVILAAGAIGSPQLMLLSGVGPAAQLQRPRGAAGARAGGRRRKPARSPAGAPDLQLTGAKHAQPRFTIRSGAAPASTSTTHCSAAGR